MSYIFDNPIWSREKNSGINGKMMVAQKLQKDCQQVIKVICLHQNEDFVGI